MFPYFSHLRFLPRPTIQEAKSVCKSRHGKLVEIESQAELDYLYKHIGDYFYLGAQKDPQSGLWHWISSGKTVNLGLFSDVTHRNDLKSIAITDGGRFESHHFESRFDRSYRTIIPVICETPSKYVKDYPEPPLDPYVHTFEEYKSNVTNATYLFSKTELPWMSAQAVCEEQGGSLAETETPRENADLLQQIMDSTAKQGFYWWLGAKSNHSTMGQTQVILKHQKFTFPRARERAI